jgi:hypothetical protein
MLYEIVSPDAFLRSYIARNAYAKTVYVGRAFQKKTNENRHPAKVANPNSHASDKRNCAASRHRRVHHQPPRRTVQSLPPDRVPHPRTPKDHDVNAVDTTVDGHRSDAARTPLCTSGHLREFRASCGVGDAQRVAAMYSECMIWSTCRSTSDGVRPYSACNSGLVRTGSTVQPWSASQSAGLVFCASS